MKLLFVYIIVNWWSFLVALDQKGERMACSLMLNNCWLPYMHYMHKKERIKNVIEKGSKLCGKDNTNNDFSPLEKYATTLREFIGCSFADHIENLFVSFDVLKYEHFVKRGKKWTKFAYPTSNEDWDNWWSLTKWFVVSLSKTAAMWDGTYKMLEDALPGFKDNEYLMQATNLLSRFDDVGEEDLQKEFSYGQHKFTRMELVQTSVRSVLIRYFKSNCSLKWTVNPASVYRNLQINKFKIKAIDDLSFMTTSLETFVTNLGLFYSLDEKYKPKYRYKLTTDFFPYQFIYPGSKTYWLWDGIKKEAKVVRKELQYYFGEYYKLKHYPMFIASTIMASFYNQLYSYLRIYIDKLMTDNSNRFGFFAKDDPMYLRCVRESIASIAKFNGNGTSFISLVQINNRIENPTDGSDTLTAVDLSLFVKVQLNIFDHLLEIQFSEDTQDTQTYKITDKKKIAIAELEKYETNMSQYIKFLNHYVKNYFWSY